MTTTTSRPRLTRKVPQRTCVACHSVRAKRDLVRVVRTVDGAVAVDPTGKKSGRGAYLCRQRGCWELGLKRGVLERALKQPVPNECRPALEAFAATLPEKVPEGSARPRHDEGGPASSRAGCP